VDRQVDLVAQVDDALDLGGRPQMVQHHVVEPQ
jgi:hypothetical protein